MAENVIIERTCWMCQTVCALTVPAPGFAAWDMGRGAYAADAFPDLTAGEREMLISGTCPRCSEGLFADTATDTDPRSADPRSADPRSATERADDDKPHRRGNWRNPPEIAQAGRANLADEVATALRRAQYYRPGRRWRPTPGPEQTHERVSPDANPGGPGVTSYPPRWPGRTAGEQVPTPAVCIERARLGLTAEGEPATRGHLRPPSPDWPRCSAEIPGLDGPIFQVVRSNICHRPATLLMGFSADYVNAMIHHTCPDPDCVIAAIGADPDAAAVMRAKHAPICAMHLPLLRQSERDWLAAMGPDERVDHVFELSVIGVETVSLLGGGHPEGAQVLDLRPVTEPGLLRDTDRPDPS